MTRKLARLGLATALLGLALPGATPARAADPVVIGVIGPAGDARAAVEVAAADASMPNPGLWALPIGGLGLPHLGGAFVAIAYADDLGNPSVAAAETLRLITKAHITALVGAGASPEMLAAASVAERHGVPFVVSNAEAPDLTARGYRFVFRTAPLVSDYGRVYGQFLGALKAGGTAVAKVALVFDGGAAARVEADALRTGLRAAGFAPSDVTYQANATDLTAAVAQLKSQNPDAAIFICDAADAVLFAKTMQNAGYKPAIEIGDGSGFSDPGFVAAVGNLTQGLIGRSVWRMGKPQSSAASADARFRKETGHGFDAASAQAAEGLLVLAEAIDRAGSTDPTAIQAALRQTDLQRNQLIVGYDGVKFDATGQNALASTYLTQLQGKSYVTVWPADPAQEKPTLPFKGWE